MLHRFVRPAILTALLLSLPVPAHAAGPNMLKKLGRGLVNATTGWLEIPVQMDRAKKDDTSVLWAVTGMFQGATLGAKRMLLGVWDVATFPFSPYDRPLMDPDTLVTERPPRKTDG